LKSCREGLTRGAVYAYTCLALPQATEILLYRQNDGGYRVWLLMVMCQTMRLRGSFGFLLGVANRCCNDDKSGGLGFNINDWHRSMVNRTLNTNRLRR
jgi:hypothetical protein